MSLNNIQEDIIIRHSKLIDYADNICNDFNADLNKRLIRGYILNIKNLELKAKLRKIF